MGALQARPHIIQQKKPEESSDQENEASILAILGYYTYAAEGTD
jgi:hypothetical protein